MYDMFVCFWFIVQTLRICCDAWQCIFSIAYPPYETRVITLHFVGYCVMIYAEQSTGHFYTNLAGSENDLNHVLSTFVDSEHEITNFCHSRYVDISEIQSIFQNSPNEFLILTFNIQSVNAKFDNLFPLLPTLHLKVYILVWSVCKRHGHPVIQIYRYYNFLDTNLSTRVVNVLSTVTWWYT